MIKDTSSRVSWGISLGSMHWAACGLTGDSYEQLDVRRRPANSVPAAVLLGWLSGESPRLDYWMPPHPRGTANDWPLEAIVNRETGSGRFPLAAAWTGRQFDLSWNWTPDKESRQLSSLDAICIGASKLAKIYARSAPCAIAIPNDFKQREQQRLLDVCASYGVNASLIWLPVAAILAWLKDNHDTLPRPKRTLAEQLQVPVIHADWGGIRCSTLILVNRMDEFGSRWVPARRRPDLSDWFTSGFGWESMGACNKTNASRVWHHLFGTSDVSSVRRAVTDSTVLQQIANWTIQPSNPAEVDSELAKQLAAVDSAAVMIFVGDFARQVANGPKVTRILSSHTSFVADGSDGEELVAQGASIFAQDRLLNRTSYLDTLPNLELFVDRSSHYDWLRLLGDGEHFVSGGQQWELPKPIEGLAVRRGAASIKLVVAHDEYKGVRELQVKLDRPAEVDLAASLRVSATPAQGNARLVLTTETLKGIPSRSILANWERMTQLFEDDSHTPMDKISFEKSRPKAFPQLRPRPADVMRWDRFCYLAKLFLLDATDANQLGRRPMGLGRVLDSTRIASGKSAISSEGTAPPGEDQQVVNRLTSILFSYLQKHTRTEYQDQTRVIAVKTLAFMSAHLEGLDEWICEEIGESGGIDEPTCMIAGNCIRSPEAACHFIERLLEFIPRSNKQRLLNYQMQALGRLLSQRNDILNELPISHAYQLVEECLKVFSDELRRSNLAWLFEHSGLVVVYALRYRICEPDFLDPESELAVRAKEQFELAMAKLATRLKSSKRSYGVANPVTQRIQRLKDSLQQLIDYVDKKGEGDILLALDD